MRLTLAAAGEARVDAGAGGRAVPEYLLHVANGTSLPSLSISVINGRLKRSASFMIQHPNSRV